MVGGQLSQIWAKLGKIHACFLSKILGKLIPLPVLLKNPYNVMNPVTSMIPLLAHFNKKLLT